MWHRICSHRLYLELQMMKKVLLLLAAPLVCLAMIPSQSRPDDVKVDGSVVMHKPYCGGMAPTPEMARGVLKPMPNTNFFIRKGDGNHAKSRIAASFTTDDEGNFSVNLKPGQYSVMHGDKLLSLEEFKKKNGPKGAHYKAVKSPCFAEWHQRADFLLNVRADTTVTLRYSSRCFEGMNPCIRYTGPLPP